MTRFSRGSLHEDLWNHKAFIFGDFHDVSFGKDEDGFHPDVFPEFCAAANQGGFGVDLINPETDDAVHNGFFPLIRRNPKSDRFGRNFFNPGRRAN
jgi:hypothetical protein